MNIDSLIWRSCDASCGVYELLLRGEIRYIGIGRNVKRRVGEHRWERVIEFDDAIMADVPREHLLSVERELIYLHKPPFNVNCVGWELRGRKVGRPRHRLLELLTPHQTQ